MSDVPPVTGTPTPPALPPPPPPPPVVDTTALQAEVEKWKALARQHEDRSKANYTQLQQLQQQQATATAADQTDMQKIQAQLAALTERAEKAERQAVVAGVAQAKGVPAELLVGNTQQELETHADLLLAFRSPPPTPPATGDPSATEPTTPVTGDPQPVTGAPTPPAAGTPAPATDPKPGAKPAPTGRPKENLVPGAAPNAEPEPDPAELAEKILKSRLVI